MRILVLPSYSVIMVLGVTTRTEPSCLKVWEYTAQNLAKGCAIRLLDASLIAKLLVVSVHLIASNIKIKTFDFRKQDATHLFLR